MYIITNCNNYQYKLYRREPGEKGWCSAVYINGMANYSLAFLLKAISIHTPTDSVFSTTIVLYYIDYLPVVVDVNSWSDLREEVKNLTILDAL